MAQTPARYPIPAAVTRITLRVANSRFIATIGEARTVEEARAFIDSVRAEFPDATHHVFAFRVGFGASITEGMSDDGEPSGTAARPTLAVLRGAVLGDVVIVTTRYFGGTRLGTGGLVRAYTEAAQQALQALPLAERVARRRGVLELPYALYEPVKRLVAAQGGDVAEETFAAAVTLTLVFPEDAVPGFEAALRETSGGRLAVRWEPGITEG